MKFFKRFFLCSSRGNDGDRMRKLRKKTGDTRAKQPTDPRPAAVNFFKFINRSLRRSLEIPKSTNDTETDSPPTCCRPEVVVTFEENLLHGHLAQAGKQLIQQEEYLFGVEIGKEEKDNWENKEKLKTDYEALLKEVWLSVDSSMNVGAEGLENLKSAVNCILQEEEQDRRWTKESEALAPAWRPRQCRKTHDAWLEKMVEKRMEELDEVTVGDTMSSLKRDICKMGKRIKEDLLKVAKDLQSCYPEEFDICNVYTRLYHCAFSKRLVKITEYELGVDDSAYLLFWVNNYYPNEILNHTELKEKINCNMLGDVLPVHVARPLEEQYLSEKEAEVETWVSTALRKQQEAWLSGALPELIEGHYSSISIDVIQCIDVAVKDTSIVVGEPKKAQRIMCQLKCFLMSYMKSLEDFLNGKHRNTKAVLNANLASLEQFEEYIVKKSDFITEDMRTCCLSLVNTMKDYGYKHFSKIIYADMKVQYRKLGTQSWLTESSCVMRDLLEGLNRHIEEYRDLKTSCFEEFIGRLHSDVMVEYVHRLLKKKLKLKGRGQQEAAARLLCEDSNALHALFTEEGSKEDWLSDILPKIAEVLKLQDPSMIQLEIVTLAQDYPDLSDRHVSELLHLKRNLSTSDITMIKKSLSENRNSVISPNTRTFFSRVHSLDRNTVASLYKYIQLPH